MAGDDDHKIGPTSESKPTTSSTMSSSYGANAVTVKMPAFMDTAASAWFEIIDAQFKLANITRSDTKYYHVLSHLPPDVIIKIDPDIKASTDYDGLRKQVIELHEKSKTEIFINMMSKTKLTGKPSHFLQELMEIDNKVHVGEDFLRHQFLHSLPDQYLPALASHSDLPLKRLGKIADDLAPYLNKSINQASAFHVSNNYNQNASSSRSNSSNYGNNKNFNGNNNPIPIGIRPYSQSQRPRICRAHIYYADKANTCKPWCKYPNKNRNIRVLPNSRPSSPNSRSSSPSPSNTGN